MSLAVALDQLSRARLFVEEGERYMRLHRETIDMMERCGYDTLDAVLHMEILEEMQERYVAHRDRVERRVLALVKPEDG